MITVRFLPKIDLRKILANITKVMFQWDEMALTLEHAKCFSVVFATRHTKIIRFAHAVENSIWEHGTPDKNHLNKTPSQIATVISVEVTTRVYYVYIYEPPL